MTLTLDDILDDQGNIRPLAKLEREIILLALKHCEGNIRAVKRGLKLGRSTLYRKLSEQDRKQARSLRYADSSATVENAAGAV